MSSSSESASMDQVRELLMGTQLKDMENKLQRQEERIMQEVSGVNDNLKDRIKSLENFMNSEMASVLHRLQEEQTARAEAIKNEQRDRALALSQLADELAKDLNAREEALERKVTAVSSTLDSAERELRQLMLTENARFSEKVEEKYKEALAIITATSDQLRGDLLSRSDIAGIFTEAAVRLAGQWPADAVQQSGKKSAK